MSDGTKAEGDRFPTPPDTAKKVTGMARRYVKLLALTWRSLKESKLGIVGLGVILMFGVMALLAPVISPYKPSFMAPDQDVFTIVNHTATYDAAATYNEPIIGPTTPKYNTVGGGLWLIVSSTDGKVHMDFMLPSFTNVTPFEMGNASVDFDIADLGLSPPLTQMRYICPGRDANINSGDKIYNGLVVFLANDTFAVVDPFGAAGPELLLNVSLDFTPEWLSVDPTSTGDMYDIPLQQATFSGVVQRRFGPYRYIALAGEGRLVAYRMEYLWNSLGIRSFVTLVDANVTVVAKPLPYNNLEQPNASCILVPTPGHIDIYNMSGGLESSLPLTIGSESANVSAPIAYSKSLYPPLVFLPLESTDGAAIGCLSLLNQTIFATHVFDEQGAKIPVGPDTSSGGVLLAAVELAEPTSEGTETVVYRLTFAGALDPNFKGEIPEKVKSMFFVTEVSKVFLHGVSGKVYAGLTTISSTDAGARKGIQVFYDTEQSTKYLCYVGSFSGTKYGSLTSGEVNGLYFDEGTATATIFQFVGTIKAPLPPGTYASGNTYYLGTDNVGHDILTHLIYGSRIAFLVGVLSAFFAVFFGTLLGLISGYYGGWTDTLLMRFTDIILVLPTLPIVLILTAIMGPNIWNIILIIALLGWPGIARVIRAQALSLKERPFIDAARVGGSSDAKIIIKHIAPNVLPFTFLYMTLMVAGAIITEAALSFLGLGDPKSVTWGILLSTIQTSGNTLTAWWWLLPPGIAITVLSLGFYLVGRAVDEIVNPRLRRR